MDLNPLSLLEKAVNEHGSSVILKERIDLVKDLLAKVEREKVSLEKELAQAKEELAQTKDELLKLKAQLPGAGFVEFAGVKFKRKPSGAFESTVYCPSCEVGMGTTSGGNMPFICGKCQSLSGFKARELKAQIQELEKEYPA